MDRCNVCLRLACLALGVYSSSCAREPAQNQPEKVARSFESEVIKNMRKAMVEQLKLYKIRDPKVLKAMAKVRRHEFIPEPYRKMDTAYGDHPWPIGHDQTISQPYIVAYMTEKMALKPGEKALEIGTGSGYQAAVLAEMDADVYSIEIIPELADHARKVLKAEGYEKIRVLTGDGYKGWPEHAPFDVILAACAPESVPAALVEQLAENGRMIIPVGEQYAQRLVVLRKREGKIIRENDLPVRFVPMVRGESRQ